MQIEVDPVAAAEMRGLLGRTWRRKPDTRRESLQPTTLSYGEENSGDGGDF
jgi:hypothetical protein